MKKSTLLLLTILTLSCNSKPRDVEETIPQSSEERNTQNLEETTDFLEYIIQEYPPFPNFQATFKVFSPDNSSEDAKNDEGGFFYSIEMVDNEKNMIGSKASRVFIKDIKNIILKVANYENQKKYTIRLGLKNQEDTESFAIAYDEGFKTAKIDEVSIILIDDLELAMKVKKALIHLGKLNGVEIKELNSF